MIVDILALLVLGTILTRLGRTQNFAERISFYLLFFLTFALFSYGLLKPDAPRWFRGFCLFLFLAQECWLLLEPLLEGFGRKWGLRNELQGLKKERGGLYEVVAACRLLSQAKLGALLAVERRKSLEEWIRKGIAVDAKISREIIFSVFTPPGALHDGSAVIRNGRLAACGVIVPLTQMLDFPKELGTRHRAAVGFSEVTDALCVVVSEESGSISLADGGSLYYDIPLEKLPLLLERALRFQLRKNKSPVQTLETVKA